VVTAARQHGHKPLHAERSPPLRAQGVGDGAQVCGCDCTLPVALRQKGGSSAAIGKLVTPSVSSSDLPGLLGLSALKKNRGIVDFNTMELHFCGPVDYDLAKATPPGTDSFQLELALSGHMVLPCCDLPSFGSHAASEEYTLTLISKTSQQKSSSAPPAPQQPPRREGSSRKN
jgi:hypothetical protein